MNKILRYIEGDKVIWMVAFGLSLFSLAAVYSASCYEAFSMKIIRNPESYLIRQFAILLTGFFIMFVIHNIAYPQFSRVAQIALVLSVILLLLTMMFGENESMAKRRILLPVIGVTFQSSDFAKIGLVLYLSRILTVKSHLLNNFRELRFSVFLPVLLIAGMIAPSNTSTAIIILIISFAMFFLAGMPFSVLKKFVLISAFAYITVLGISHVVNPNNSRLRTVISRLEDFFSSHKESDDSIKLKTAIAKGGILGVGPGNGTQKTILDNTNSDYIFSLIIEEYGLWGGALVLLLFLVLLLRGLKITRSAPTKYSSLLAFGITIMITVQAYIHLLVTVRLFPITGQPLPFVSNGGSSIWMSFVAMGILASVGKTVYKNEKNQVWKVTSQK